MTKEFMIIMTGSCTKHKKHPTEFIVPTHKCQTLKFTLIAVIHWRYHNPYTRLLHSQIKQQTEFIVFILT